MKGRTKRKLAPEVTFRALVVNGKASLVASVKGSDGKSRVRVVQKLPGRLLPKKGKHGRLGLNGPDLGRNLEKAFQAAVKRATR